MQPKLHVLVHHVVETGVTNGFNEARDMFDDPSDEQIIETIIQALIDEFNVYFEFLDTVE